MIRKIFIVSTAFIALSCNDDFSPNGPYTPKLIVYSILDNAKDTQYVRVYSSYSPEQYSPGAASPNTEISGASVTIHDDTSTYVFSDTLVTVQIDSLTTRDVRLYTSVNFRPKERKIYYLTVQSENFPVVHASATALEAAQIFVFDTKPIFEPLPDVTITFDLFLGKNVSAYLGVCFIEYEILINGNWILHTKEMPIAVDYNLSGQVSQKYYALPRLFLSAGSTNRNVKIGYTTQIYLLTIDEIKEQHLQLYNAKQLRFKSVRFQLTQFDNDVFTYYSIANNFPGSSTIRLDEPDYTNLVNGFGIFGAIATQNKIFGIPSDFP